MENNGFHHVTESEAFTFVYKTAIQVTSNTSNFYFLFFLPKKLYGEVDNLLIWASWQKIEIIIQTIRNCWRTIKEIEATNDVMLSHVGECLLELMAILTWAELGSIVITTSLASETS